MKKKLTAIALVVVLLAVTVVGGSLAYFTDTDDATNTFTVGSVDILQHEMERGANGMQAFTDKQEIVPAVGPVEWAADTIQVGGSDNQKVFTEDLKNVIDKFVYVENTGKSDAYVRTIIALEAPGFDPNDYIHINTNDEGVTQSGPFMVTARGVDYVCFVFTYTDVLAPKDVTPVSLAQVFLDSKTTNADVVGYGDTWEILAFSEAAQADGFANAATALNEAFGEVDVPYIANLIAK